MLYFCYVSNFPYFDQAVGSAKICLSDEAPLKQGFKRIITVRYAIKRRTLPLPDSVKGHTDNIELRAVLLSRSKTP